MLYPSAIDDDVNDFDPEEIVDIDQHDTVKPKKSSKSTSKMRNKDKILDDSDNLGDFADGFSFDITGGEETRNQVDDLDGLKMFLKQNQNPTNMLEKIKEERLRMRKKVRRQTNGDVEILESDDDKDTNGQVRAIDEEDADADQISNINTGAQNKDKLRLKQQPKKEGNGNYFDSNSDKIVQATANPEHTFDTLNLSRSLLKAIFEAGYQQPTPIQKVCIPVALAGRDICACSATGTGKTAAFMLPILERLLYKPKKQKSTTRVLILVPTRELAIQVFQVSRRLAKYTNVEICLAAGGLDLKAQEAALRLGLDIVIATPGRLIDHLHNSPNFSLSDIEVLVLDEADRILEEQFMAQMKEIIKLCARNRQTLLFSATMTEEVEDLANLSLNKPVKLFVNENTDVTANLRQEFIRIRSGAQENRENENKRREAIVAALIERNFPDRCIIFMRTKRDCQRMYILFRLLGIKIGQLHGNLTQIQRIEALSAFKRQNEVKILCATDLAARGLDIEGVMTIINMHMPNTLKQYIHRVGRTARAGLSGRSISLIGERERKLMKEILKMNRKDQMSPSPSIQRTIPSEVVDLYLKRIQELEQSVTKLQEEEKLEKQFQQAEHSLKKAEDTLKDLGNKKLSSVIPKQRTWFKADRRAKKGTLDLKGRKRISKGRKREEKKERKHTENKNDSRLSNKVAEKKTRGKSSFTHEIADISQNAVKRHRHGPDDMQFKSVKRMKQKDGVIQRGKRN